MIYTYHSISKTNIRSSLQLPPYMIIGAGSGIVLYLAKYSLYGLALLLGPGRDKYAAAAIEIDLGTVPEGNWIQWAVYYNNFSS